METGSFSALSLKYSINDGEKILIKNQPGGAGILEDTYTWKNESENSVKFSFLIEGSGATYSGGAASGRVHVSEIKDDQGRPIAFGNSQ